MPRFSHVIFDLDGTLTNNTSGIKNSLDYALRRMQLQESNDAILEKFIGPPLQWGFSNIFGLNERNTKLAVEYFREYYGENGWHENVPYPGIKELLEELNSSGVKLYIATSKLEKFANRIIKHFEFDRYIIQLKGADYGGNKATKSQIITNLMMAQQIVASQDVAMIGDTVFDIEGGKENGISTVAVNYGFGEEEKLKEADPDYWAEDVEELFEVLIS